MDQCNLHFNIITIYLSIICWIKLSVCWKLDSHNLFYTNQDVLYNCPLNSMCRCFPNATKLMEINCNEVTLYKFPGKSIFINLSRISFGSEGGRVDWDWEYFLLPSNRVIWDTFCIIFNFDSMMFLDQKNYVIYRAYSSLMNQSISSELKAKVT
jgi:hypothetical protein